MFLIINNIKLYYKKGKGRTLDFLTTSLIFAIDFVATQLATVVVMVKWTQHKRET